VGDRAHLPWIGVLGLGEAGGAIARDLAAAGARVRGYDPIAAVPPGVEAAASEADAVRGCELAVSLTTAECALAAWTAAGAGFRAGSTSDGGAVWADMNTSGPELKRQLAAAGAEIGVPVADVAIMAPVPGQGLRVPMLASGPGAARVRDLLEPLGARIEVIDAPAGVAATRKLLRSVFYKGMSAAVVEALRAAEGYQLDDWMREHIGTEFDRADHSMVARMLAGSYQHAVRRAAEMAAAADLVQAVGVAPHISGGARDQLRELVARGQH
jgi:3-hydroxyisobutyrate dehydrogenase-like beta-hydroxyacid dehydrogenase